MRLAVVVAAVVLVSGAAPAQFFGRIVGPSGPPLAWGGVSVGPGIERGTADIRDRIHDGRENGQLSAREARQLRRQADGIDTLADRFGRDGLSDDESRELQARALALRDQVAAARLHVGGIVGRR